MSEQIVVLATSEVANHIEFIEVEGDGIYIYFKDGTVEFYAWKENGKINSQNGEE